MNTKTKHHIPFNVQLVICFLFLLSLCQFTNILISCMKEQKTGDVLFLEIVFHSIYSLIAILLAIQLILRTPFARFCTLFLFLTFPLIKGIGLVLSPISWENLQVLGRLQAIITAVIFVSMAFLLLQNNVSIYLKGNKTIITDQSNSKSMQKVEKD